MLAAQLRELEAGGLVKRTIYAHASQGRLHYGLDVPEGARGDVRSLPRTGQRARQQHVGSPGEAGQSSRGHAELSLALERERALVIRQARRFAGLTAG